MCLNIISIWILFSARCSQYLSGTFISSYLCSGKNKRNYSHISLRERAGAHPSLHWVRSLIPAGLPVLPHKKEEKRKREKIDHFQVLVHPKPADRGDFGIQVFAVLSSIVAGEKNKVIG